MPLIVGMTTKTMAAVMVGTTEAMTVETTVVETTVEMVTTAILVVGVTAAVILIGVMGVVMTVVAAVEMMKKTTGMEDETTPGSKTTTAMTTVSESGIKNVSEKSADRKRNVSAS